MKKQEIKIIYKDNPNQKAITENDIAFLITT